MVKTTMSTDGSESEMDSLASTRDKLKIQQRLIDISARNLQSTRLSSRDFSPGSHSSSGEVQSTIEENITLIEVGSLARASCICGMGAVLVYRGRYLR